MEDAAEEKSRVDAVFAAGMADGAYAFVPLRPSHVGLPCTCRVCLVLRVCLATSRRGLKPRKPFVRFASTCVEVRLLFCFKDLLIRLGLAGKVFPEDEGEAGEGGRSQETTAHGKRNEHRGKAKKRGSRELQDELLESLRRKKQQVQAEGNALSF